LGVKIGQDAGQGYALDTAHGVERLALGIEAQFVHWDNAWVFELAGDLGLGEEPGDAFRSHLRPRLQALKRNGATKGEVSRGVNRSHAPLADGVEEF
jgi:hypothetical protein